MRRRSNPTAITSRAAAAAAASCCNPAARRPPRSPAAPPPRGKPAAPVKLVADKFVTVAGGQEVVMAGVNWFG